MQPKLLEIYRQSPRRKSYQVRSKFRLCLFLVLILTILITLLSPLWLRGKAMELVTIETTTINAGDTLWHIAKQTLPSGRDIRDYILEIIKLNQLEGANIIAGQELVIPIYGSDSTVVYTEASDGTLKIGMND